MTKRSTKPLAAVNLYLLKEGVAPKDAIAKGKKPQTVVADKRMLADGVLYVQAPPAKPPAWRAFLRPAFPTGLPKLLSQHASALLFFNSGNRTFAATFG